MIKRILRRWPWLEPWYDWGGFTWERLDGRGEGDVDDAGRFELEWLGLKILLIVGRQPAIRPFCGQGEEA